LISFLRVEKKTFDKGIIQKNIQLGVFIQFSASAGRSGIYAHKNFFFKFCHSTEAIQVERVQRN
jgi:hypothetical protein